MHERDQPGLEVDASKDISSAIYPVHPVADNQAAHSIGDNNVLQSGSRREWRHAPCGLQPLWFGILIGIITTIVIGAAIGGGLGAALSKSSSRSASTSQNNSSSLQPAISSTSPTSGSASPTSTATLIGDYAPLAPSDVRLLQHPCPSQSYTYQTNDDPSFPPQVFNWRCGIAYQGNGRGQVGITLMQLSAYTSQQCVEACGGLNIWRNETICSAVTFQATMSSFYADGRGNCWLFNGTMSTYDDTNAISAHI